MSIGAIGRASGLVVGWGCGLYAVCNSNGGGGARDGGRVGRRGVLVMDCVRRAPMDDRDGLLLARGMDAVRRGRSAAGARGQGYLMGWAAGGGG